MYVQILYLYSEFSHEKYLQISILGDYAINIYGKILYSHPCMQVNK